MRPTFHARTILASLALAVAAVGSASAASIPISTAGYVIDQPGQAYHLTTNLNGSGLPFTIIIAASNVSLNLNGKTLSGYGPYGNGVDGILVLPDVCNVHISGGTIKGYAAGIHLAAPQKVTIRNMTIYKNLVGIVGGKSHISVVYSLIADNGFDGVYLTGDNNHVCNNRVVRNGDEKLLDEFLGSYGGAPKKGCEGSTAGIRIEGDKAKIVCNYACDNKGFGISAEGDNHVIYNNTACNNCRSGIRLKGDNSVVNRNRASQNQWNGLHLPWISDYNRIEDNVALQNQKLDIWDGNLPKKCTNEYEHNFFETSNDPTGDCIK